MTDLLIGIIRARSLKLLDDVKKTLNATTAEVLERPRDGWPLWKQFYHLLYWQDYWFIDPLAFRPPVFHEEHFLQAQVTSPSILSKQKLLGYYDSMRERIERYLQTITEEELGREQTVRGQPRARLDMILGQLTHVSHHLGYTCATVRAETGRSIWDQGPTP